MSITEQRRSADERRDHILISAASVFGRRGYFGATTDLVAKAAGISQPYVVRLFGTKEALFLAVVASAKSTVLAGFRSALDEVRESGTPDIAGITAALGERYVQLARESGVHESLMQAFMLGSDPVIGATARAGYLEIWSFLREEAGLGVEDASAFLAQGMMINVLLGLDLPRHSVGDPAAQELVDAACGPGGLDALGFGT